MTVHETSLVLTVQYLRAQILHGIIVPDEAAGITGYILMTA